MAESYKDITGPVTVLVLCTVKEELAEEMAKYGAKVFGDQRRKALEGKLPGYESLDCTRNGNKFAIWERYADAETCERMLPTNYARHIGGELHDVFTEPPSFFFFPTDGLGVPSSRMNVKASKVLVTPGETTKWENKVDKGVSTPQIETT